MICLVSVLLISSFSLAGQKVLVIGMDGLDPDMLADYRAQGLMPNFDRFIKGEGHFGPLGTSIPPQSPVAWSCFSTGTDPGGHGIFDFIHRDPSTLLPYLSTSSSQAPTGSWRLGSWQIPRGGGPMENLCQGPAFWQLLDDAGEDVTVFKVPANFPPVDCEARTLSGMGTPDILGTYGIFSYLTNDPFVDPDVDGGRVIRVKVDDGKIEVPIPGPVNGYKVDESQSEIPLEIVVDAENKAALFNIEGEKFLLNEGEWSDWVDLDFPMVPVVKGVAGICRFYLMEASPYFRLYVTPIQIHPTKPEMPISTPPAYSGDLARNVGLFFTQGLPEDSKALEEGVLSDAQYVSQSQLVLDERVLQFQYELDRFTGIDDGFLFFYFNTPDQSCHVLWRCFDEDSPTHKHADPAFRHRVRDLYVALDGVLGKAMDQCDPETHLMVISDHGFAAFHRAFHANTWLRENGYLFLLDGVEPADTDFLSGIDWTRTRAYSLGINGLYLNMKGREKYGIVTGQQRESLLQELVQKLEATIDPGVGTKAIKYAYRGDIVYSGANRDQGPDIVLGYHRGWRGSNESALGAVTDVVFEDNMMKWSGDHCIAADEVPGVVLSNRAFTLSNPELKDMAPTILGLFGVDKPASMTGRDLFSQEGRR